MQRTIFSSRDIYQKMTLLKKETLRVYSFFPIDRMSCDCQPSIKAFKEKLSIMPPHKQQEEIEKLKQLECPRDKSVMKRYELYCRSCGAIQGYCWATTPKLEDWCDFHYAQWTDGTRWFGCLTPNISPIDEKLTLECCCGNDSRDFRANMTLPGKVAYEMEEENRRGRDFSTHQSRFGVREVTASADGRKRMINKVVHDLRR